MTLSKTMSVVRFDQRTEIALVGIETSGKTVNITGQIRTASASCDRREADKYRGLLAFLGQERSRSDVREVAI